MRSELASNGGTSVTDVLLERDVELDLLADLLRDVGAGRGRALLFEAAAGLGKSALLERAISAGREAGLVVLRARGHQLERGFAWGVARSLFEASLWGRPRSERDRLLDGPAAPARPVFGDSDGQGPGLGPDAGFAITHGLYWLALRLAEQEPLLVVVDDAHWADDPSLRLADLPVRPRLGGADRCARRGPLGRAGVGGSGRCPGGRSGGARASAAPAGRGRGRRARPATAGGCRGGLLPALLRAHRRQSTAAARAVGGARGQRPAARRDGPGGRRDDGGPRAGALGAAPARRDGPAGPGAGGGRRGVRGRRTAGSGRRAGRAGAGRGEDRRGPSWRAPTSCAPAIRWASFTRCCAPPSTAGWRSLFAATPTGAPRSC